VVFGNHEFDRRQAAGIGRHVGEDVLERDIAAGDRGGERNIEWPSQGGDEREKSSRIVSPEMTRSSAMLSGTSVMPSLSRKSSYE
jgi:hypothetical protein